MKGRNPSQPSLRSGRGPQWSHRGRGLSQRTAHTLLLIHKALSKREPDKQHYYYHQSPRAEETEAAKGERAAELAHSREEEKEEEEEEAVGKVHAAWAGLPAHTRSEGKR